MPFARTRVVASSFLTAGFLLTALACASLLNPGAGRTPTPAPPSATPRPTETAVPLYEQVNLNAIPAQEQGQLYGYSIKTETPVLVGSDDPRVKNFNDEMQAIVKKAVDDFKKNLANLAPTPLSSASYLEMHFNLVSPPGNLISIKFDTQTYYTGAAHPSDASVTATYDLEAGRDLSLADLFVPDADYLTPIARFCTDQLSTRDISFQGFELGATATPQNYRNWNITSDGLMITFDEYQVAPYAAGPQTVVIPYNDLAQIIEPDGPLAPYMH